MCSVGMLGLRKGEAFMDILINDGTATFEFKKSQLLDLSQWLGDNRWLMGTSYNEELEILMVQWYDRKFGGDPVQAGIYNLSETWTKAPHVIKVGSFTREPTAFNESR